MLKFRLGEINKYRNRDRLTFLPSNLALQRRSWRNWFMLAGVSFITTIGLATAIPPLLGRRIVNPWPWAKTDLVLLVGLSLIVLSFIVYLTQQQRRVICIYNQMQRLKENIYEARRKNDDRLYALFSVSRIIGSETNLQGVFDKITKLCVDTFKCHRASLMMFNPIAQELEVKSASGRNSERVIGTRQKMGEGIAGWAAANRESLFLVRHCDLSKYPGLKLENPSICGAMVVPIMLRDKLVGVLNVSTKSRDINYDEDDLRALKVFAENAGAFIRHQEHAEWMRSTIQRLEDSLREKDRLLNNNNGKTVEST